MPGPAHRVLTDAVTQAYVNGASSRWLPVVLGTVGALITGSTLFGQLERGLNRIYGVEQDRPTVQKYGLALLLTVTAGACSAVAFLVFAFGREIGSLMGSEARTIWDIARWPIALALHRRRDGPAVPVVAAPPAAGVVVARVRRPRCRWCCGRRSTLALGLMFRVSTSFGDTYGPLAGIVALQIWTLLSSISILYGAAVAAQLEAVRAGEPEVQEPAKIDDVPATAEAGALVSNY